jgi:hypothetical protein
MQLLVESNPDFNVSHQDLCEVVRDSDGIFEDELVIMKNTTWMRNTESSTAQTKYWRILFKVPSLISWKDMKEINWNKKWFMNR